MASHVHRLVMRRPLERRQPSGDGVVGTRLDLHVVRRVGVAQVDRLAIEQPVEVLWFTAVAAEQPMLAQNPRAVPN